MSQELWEKTHQARAWGKYPDVDVVRLLMRHFPSREIREKISILDLGCGAGANSLMFIEEGFKAHGIDFSPAAIERIGSSLVEKKLECHQNSFIVGDFKRLPWNDNFFDVVVDCMSVYANETTVISQVFQEIARVLKKNGRIISRSWGYETMLISEGRAIDGRTINAAKAGPCVGFGVSHFFDQAEILELFANFDLDEFCKTTKHDILADKHVTEWTVSGVLK